MKRKDKNTNIIKLGSETATEKEIYHLLRDGDRGKYVVMVQPYETWQGKKIRSYKNWHRLTNGTLGECRRAIKEASASKPEEKRTKTKQKSIAAKPALKRK